MDSFSIFVLILFGIWTLNAMHVRYTRANLIKYLQDDNKTAEEIEIIMGSYKE